MDLLLQKLKTIINRGKLVFTKFFLFFKKALKKNKSKNSNTDKEIVYSLAPSKIPQREQLRHLFKLFNPREKLLFKLAFLVFIFSLGYLSLNFYRNNLIVLPADGGVYREGAATYPQAINPLYASSRDIDADLSRLIYSSLFNYSNGKLEKDLVDTWQVSADGKEYSLQLRQGVKWHNGNILTADDVVFTVNLIKSPEFKSPLRNSLSGINVEKIDDYSVRFILAEPYADFLHLLTFGIMPKFAWENILPEAAIISELNIKPIGSGPYQFVSLVKSRGGELKEYHLNVNEDYYNVRPHIDSIIFKFFPNYEELIQALNSNEIDGVSYLPESFRGDLLAKHSLQFHYLPLPQIISLFFNQQKNSVLQELKVRQFLTQSLYLDTAINEVLGDSVIRTQSFILAPDFALQAEFKEYNTEELEALLVDSGFKKIVSNESDFQINEDEDKLSAELTAIQAYATENNLSLNNTWWLNKDNKIFSLNLSLPNFYDDRLALYLQEQWQKLGVRVKIDRIDESNLSNKLQNRDFDLLLYGQEIGLEPDVAAFWHSSQINQGLNLAQYNNSEVDQWLIDARKDNNFDSRYEKYKLFQEKLQADLPIILLYSPNYTYIQDKQVRGFNSGLLSRPSDRFAGVSDWYVKTKKRFDW